MRTINTPGTSVVDREHTTSSISSSKQRTSDYKTAKTLPTARKERESDAMASPPTYLQSISTFAEEELDHVEVISIAVTFVRHGHSDDEPIIRYLDIECGDSRRAIQRRIKQLWLSTNLSPSANIPFTWKTWLCITDHDGSRSRLALDERGPVKGFLKFAVDKLALYGKAECNLLVTVAEDFTHEPTVYKREFYRELLMRGRHVPESEEKSVGEPPSYEDGLGDRLPSYEEVESGVFYGQEVAEEEEAVQAVRAIEEDDPNTPVLSEPGHWRHRLMRYLRHGPHRPSGYAPYVGVGLMAPVLW